MAKEYNQKSFYIEMGDGRTLAFYCHTTSTRNGFCHTVWCADTDQTTKASYFNRTWESYDYQSALLKAFNKLPKADRDICKMWDEHECKRLHGETEAWTERLKAAYNGLTDGQKERLANSDIHVTNEQQANTMLMGMEMLSALNKLGV